MATIPRIIHRIGLSFVAGVISCTTFGFAQAAALTSLTAFPSTTQSQASNVTYTFNFTTATTSPIYQIQFQFSTTEGGSSKPANMDLTGATLYSTTNLGSGWTISTGSAGTGVLIISRGSSDTITSSTPATVIFDHITNPKLRDCNPTGTELSESCYVTITTFSDNEGSTVDWASTSFEVTDTAHLTFQVDGVAAGETHNGITTNVTSTGTSLAFGNIASGDVKIVAQKITLLTNAPRGYTVYAKLDSPISGSYSGGIIHPFGAVNATWLTPQAWSDPDGTTANDNTGWFGANTSDTNVSGWNSGSSKYGPLSTLARPIAYSTGPAVAGTVIYVTYALGINTLQPADVYNGTIVYDVQAGY